MFAVIKSGGKQYKVVKDDIIRVEKLNAEEGASINLNQVLMVGDDAGQTVGSPLVDGALVSATVINHLRDKKIIVFKKKRRQNYRRRNGHRQHLTTLRIDDIVGEDKKKPSTKKKTASKNSTPKNATSKISGSTAKVDVEETSKADQE